MTTYNVELIITGRESASGPLGSAGGALQRIAEIAGGILGAALFTRIAQGLQNMASAAFKATAQFQSTNALLQSLAARELIATGATDKMSEALDMAAPLAAALRKQLEDISIISPYRSNVITDTFRLAQTFGFSTKEAMTFTKALLDVAAGSGLTNDMLNRAAYNLAQVRMQGKVTAVDIRQLAMAGFDLRGVLKFVGEQFGLTLKDHNDFNKAIESGKLTWQQFTEGFAKYAEENFGGAAKRMSTTLEGLKSTFADLFDLTIPHILGPAAEVISGYLTKILGKFTSLRDSGIFDEIGTKLGESIKKWAENFNTLKQVFSGGFGAKTQAFSLEKIFNISPAFAELIIKIKNDIVDFVTTVSDNMPTLEEAGSIIGGLFDGLITFANDHYEEIKAVIAGIGAALLVFQAPAVIAAIAAIGAAIAAINWPLVAIAAVVGLLVAAWQGNWGGMRDTLIAVWTGTIQPALQQLWDWLSVNIPIALQALSDFWTLTLLPAIQSVWLWMQTTLFPMLQDLWNWLSINVPLALQALSDFWTLTLLPAIQAVWEWMSTVLFPFFQEIADFINNVFSIAITALAGFWQNVLQPALQTAYDFFVANILPILKQVGDYISATLQPIFQALSDFISGTLVPLGLAVLRGAFDGITSAIKTVTDWLGTLNDKLDNIELPDWLTPGSPTPFENGLVGVSTQIGITTGAIGSMTSAFKTLTDYLHAQLSIRLKLIIQQFEWLMNTGKTVAIFFGQTMSRAFSQLAGTVGNFATQIQRTANALRQLVGAMPSWLIPGSPTPLEIGLMGINKQMKQFADNTMGTFGSGLSFPMSSGLGGGMGSQSVSNSNTSTRTGLSIQNLNIYNSPQDDNTILSDLKTVQLLAG